MVTRRIGFPFETFDDGDLVLNGQFILVTGMKVYTRRWDGRLVVGGSLQSSYNIGTRAKKSSLIFRPTCDFHSADFALNLSVLYLICHVTSSVVRLHEWMPFCHVLCLLG